MKSHLIKAALLAALGLGGASVAQAQYTTGDLLVGFTSTTGNDLIYDLGQESSLFNGETWGGVQTQLLADVANTNGFGGATTLGSLYWGIIGSGPNSGSPRTLWTTTGPNDVLPATITGIPTFNSLYLAVGTMSQNGPSTANNFITVDSGSTTSWNMQTTPSGTATTTYNNKYENPNVLGVGSDALYAVENNGSTPALLGGFTLGSDGSLTYGTVPEPSSLALLGGAGSLILAFRNKLSRKQA